MASTRLERGAQGAPTPNASYTTATTTLTRMLTSGSKEIVSMFVSQPYRNHGASARKPVWSLRERHVACSEQFGQASATPRSVTLPPVQHARLPTMHVNQAGNHPHLTHSSVGCACLLHAVAAAALSCGDAVVSANPIHVISVHSRTADVRLAL